MAVAIAADRERRYQPCDVQHGTGHQYVIRLADVRGLNSGDISTVIDDDEGDIDGASPQREPIFNVPWPVLITAAVLIGVHVALQMISPADAEAWLISLAFIPARYADVDYAIPGGAIASATSFMTHMLVHGDVTHLAINTAWFLAFGSVVARRVGAMRFFAFVVGGGIAGALAFLTTHVGEPVPMVGASGAIAALMGGVMRFLFSAIDRGEGYLLREAPDRIALMSVRQTLTDRRIVAASVVFIAINLLAMIGFGLMGAAGAIAWEAHLGGYAFGLFAFGLFDPAPQQTSPSWTEVE